MARLRMWCWIQGRDVALWPGAWCMPRARSRRQDSQTPDLVSMGHPRWPTGNAVVPATATALLPSPQNLRLGCRSSWKLDKSFLRKINKDKMLRLLFSTSIAQVQIPLLHELEEEYELNSSFFCRRINCRAFWDRAVTPSTPVRAVELCTLPAFVKMKSGTSSLALKFGSYILPFLSVLKCKTPCQDWELILSGFQSAWFSCEVYIIKWFF